MNQPLALFFMVLPSLAFSQDALPGGDMKGKEVGNDSVYVVPEEMPYLKACEGMEKGETRDWCTFEKLQKHLLKNVRYPQNAIDSCIQGTVYVKFVIEADGNVDSIKVIRGVGGGCDEEALRVVRIMPRWMPGYQDGVAVRCAFTLPVRFLIKGRCRVPKQKSR